MEASDEPRCSGPRNERNKEMNIREHTIITADSRIVIPGALFVAVRGFASDGHDYIADAVAKGATGVICEEIPQNLCSAQNDNDGKVEFEVVENSRLALALAADEFYGHPSRKLNLVGITGCPTHKGTAGLGVVLDGNGAESVHVEAVGIQEGD